MKQVKFVVAALAAALIGNAGALACDNGQCGVDAGVFKRLLNHYCSAGSRYITETGALEVARLSASGAIAVDDFVFAFDKTCDFEGAKVIGQESQAGTLEMRTYRDAIFKYCDAGTRYLNETGAKTLAEKAAGGLVDVANYFTAFRKTCDADVADTVGGETRRGTLAMWAFERTLNHYCSAGTNYVTSEGAIELGRETATGLTSLDNVLTMYNKTCDLEQARIVGRETRAGLMSEETLERALFKSCNSGSHYITLEGAMDLARLSAHGTINLGTFFETWASTCDFEMAKTVACGH